MSEIILFAVGAFVFIGGFVLGWKSADEWEEAQIQAQMKAWNEEQERRRSAVDSLVKEKSDGHQRSNVGSRIGRAEKQAVQR